MARKKGRDVPINPTRKAGGITQQKVEPAERPDDHGHNEAEKDELIINPFRFIVPAHDLQGHSDKMRLGIQPAHARALSDISCDPRTPFRQPQDVIRHAIVRELRYLHGVIPGMKTHFYALMQFGIDLSARSELSEGMDLMFLKLDEMVSRLKRGGYFQEAERQVSYIFSLARMLDESEYKDELLRKFQQKYRGE